MSFSQSAADIFAPDGAPLPVTLKRTTHLCIAAHQDDIEIMAYHGIAACYGRDDRGFTGVVVTDGAGSPRAGAFAALSDEQMKAVRAEEQRQAARVGQYSVVIQLAHPSAVVKTSSGEPVRRDLAEILRECSPQVVYLHNPADKHDTHVAVFLRSLEALRQLPRDRRPKKVLGCEGWRDLDWLPDDDKRPLDVSAQPDLAVELLGCFQSQITGGKRYDLATMGRRLANATFHASHAIDRHAALTWAMDLTPLVQDDRLPVEPFILRFIDRLRDDVAARLRKFSA
ncbi:MAG: PIG-L family deacetylase [Opitutaceae bacterium]|nr:PIG-L family deacetylase [Opitutaceae bacterium]